ncbi:glucuronate isomerase [Rubripirellula reticaptiva]|uniref:Glucuronate isomerase n=1 Tax=Rubripirellula reticaptiva TaxID=2528013 RepID=A0A5C6F7P8_9BACT|nr:glucuronate isomerase [Rubripirellula reticaptiva]TWU57285.1 glucuronate isomerase [Rubripirellula reticaptiva]
MSDSARDSIYEAIASIRLIDPHTHINPHAAGSTTLADLLGYHYYTELAHSAGMPKDQIEESGIGPRELVRRLVENLLPLENTAQYRWLVEICRMFFGFDGDRIDASNWESLYDSAESQMASAEWPQIVLDQSNVEAVFLTNDFDDDLAGFDTDTYIPCLRTDDLVFHLSKPEVRARLAACTGIELDGSLASLRASLRQRFQHFVSRGARACAISLPPTFSPAPVGDGRATSALDAVLRRGVLADDSHKQALSRRVFWTITELCDEFGLPFDLMIGVNRGVYEGGVFQGQDLYDSRVSLIQYRELFNAFPKVKFPISVLASVTNQELVSYAWIFPNVITNGHWWYSNTPSFIARDAAARLEAVPQTKQIGYYSDAYKLEFVWPKFDMYRHVLSDILADHFVGKCRWSEERAIELGRRVLRGNVDDIFPRPSGVVETDDDLSRVDPLADTWAEEGSGPDLIGAMNSEEVSSSWDATTAGATAAGMAGGIAATAGALGRDDEADADDLVIEEVSGDELTSGEFNNESDAFDSNLIESGVEEMSDSDTVSMSDDTVSFEDATDVSDVNVDELDAEFDDQLSEPAASDSDNDVVKFETVSVTDDTVRIEVSQDELGLDPSPNDDEIKSTELADVELTDRSVERAQALDVDSISDQLDSEPLDLEAMLGDEASDSGDGTPRIHMMRGEESFETDEDSLQLTPDPVTGELTFQIDNGGGDDLVLAPEIGDSDNHQDNDRADESDAGEDLDATLEIGDEEGQVDFGNLFDDDDAEEGDSDGEPRTAKE